MNRYTIRAIVCLMLLGTAGVSWARADEGASKPTDMKPVKATLAGISIDQDFQEGPSSGGGLFEELQPRLHDVVTRLDKAAKDDKVRGIVLDLRETDIGLGKVDELRAAIARVRQSGKKVRACVQSAEARDYLIASACDEIILPPSGSLSITGLRAEITFYKGLFDKLGVHADFLQLGDFKGASEPYTRTGMSPEFRKQYEAVIDDYYKQMIQKIAADRKLDADKVAKLIDQGLFTAEEARQAGLIDRVCYADELQSALKSELGADQLVVEEKYGVKAADTDLSGFGGFVKLMEMMAGGEQGKRRSSKNPKIALVYAVGEIVDGSSGFSLFGGSTLGSDTLVEALKTAQDDETVKAIVLRVDSPGGSALASDLVWREVVRSPKPVIVSMGDVAASGGYYISMGARKIFAEPGTLTGSIGVVGGKFTFKGLFDKLGVTTDVIGRGQNSGVSSSAVPFSPSEREACLRTMREVYRQFTQKAAQGRKMDPAKLEGLAQGRVFSGRMAAESGLVDALGTLHDALAEAKSVAGFKPDDKVELLTLPEPPSLFESLLNGPGLGMKLRRAAGPMADLAGQVETLRRLFSKPAVTIMPYRVRIR